MDKTSRAKIDKFNKEIDGITNNHVSQYINIIAGSLLEKLREKTSDERGYCITPNQSLDIGFWSNPSGTWKDIQTYFASDGNVIKSQASAFNEAGSKVKIVRDRNNYFVLAHGPANVMGKGGAVDIETTYDVWKNKLVAMNKHVICIALIYVAFYSGELNPNLAEFMTVLFDKLDTNDPYRYG